MTENNLTVAVTILDREYQISCPEDEVDALRQSAQELDRQMNDIRSNGKIVGVDRIAIMAALNITNDLLKLKIESLNNVAISQDKLTDMGNRISQTIEKNRQRQL
tara:strand:+ start:1179 stop:1493 length:315 start_codon:yes stop_codon:yes gene_type:complete